MTRGKKKQLDEKFAKKPVGGRRPQAGKGKGSHESYFGPKLG